MRILIFICCASILLQACDDGQVLAPVMDIGAVPAAPRPRLMQSNRGKPRLNDDDVLLQSLATPAPLLDSSLEAGPINMLSNWVWPAEGKLIKNYSEQNKGIDIEAKLGTPIYAVLPGKVVYSRAGIRGHGHLIIIVHNSLFLSAYAYNQKTLVKEGDRVLRGQKIAEMGAAGAKNAVLHFEIRRAGVPVDPLTILNPATVR